MLERSRTHDGSGSRLRRWFDGLTLSSQFLAAGGLLMVAATAMAGLLVNALVANEAVTSKAGATALFVSTFMTPLVQELATAEVLSPLSAVRIQQLFDDAAFEARFPELEIWTPGGVIAYSRSAELIGQKFTVPRGMRDALEGGVGAELADLGAQQHVLRGWSTRYLEVYSPLRDLGTGEIIAVAEIHETTLPLEGHLRELAWGTWTIVVLLTSVIMLGLAGIVFRGSRTITRQSTDLRRRVQEAEQMSAQNLQLRLDTEHASRRVTEATESFARSVGADLHDGPAQLVGFSILKMEHLRRSKRAEERRAAIDVVETMLIDAANQIRDISKGLLLPEIEGLALTEIVARAVGTHELRTGTLVAVELAGADIQPSPAVGLCIYRFVQEGLANAYRHADGRGQRIRSEVRGGELVVTVFDNGPAERADEHGRQSGFGLTGLRHRVESIGGTMRFSRGKAGSKVQMRLRLD